MDTARSHKDLMVWQEAIRLVELVHGDSRSFPSEETFGLKNQIRRSAVSVPSNIAEEAARITTGEFLHSLGIARGSLAELETQREIAVRLGLVNNTADCLRQIPRVGKLLSALIKSLRLRAA